MKTWQYKTIALTHGTMGVSKGKINRTNLEAELRTDGRSAAAAGGTRSSCRMPLFLSMGSSRSSTVWRRELPKPLMISRKPSPAGRTHSLFASWRIG
jgi:hypothetical protein